MPRKLIKEKLNNVKSIRQIDQNGMLDLISSLPSDLKQLITTNVSKFSLSTKISSIVYSGMGGSGISGEVLKAWLEPKLKIPIVINNDYSVPSFVGPKTLFIAVSFSGNTEETLCAFDTALKMGAQAVAVSSGGLLEEKARENKAPFLKIKAHERMVPRTTYGQIIVQLAQLFERSGLIDIKSEIKETIEVIQNVQFDLLPDIALRNNISKQIAESIYGHIPVIYSYGILQPAAHRWKTQFNENAKILSWFENLPEMNHNSLVGWSNDKTSCSHVSILLRDQQCEQNNPLLARRIEATKDLGWKKAAKIIEVWSSGNSALARIMSTIHIGDFASVYLAILRKKNPLPVEIINKLKSRLER